MTNTEFLMAALNNKGGNQASTFDYLKSRISSGDYTVGNTQPCRDIEHMVNNANVQTIHRVVVDLDHYDLLQTEVPPEVMKFINSPKRLLERVVYGDHNHRFSKLFTEMERRRYNS